MVLRGQGATDHTLTQIPVCVLTAQLMNYPAALQGLASRSRDAKEETESPKRELAC